jgi:hypothetical protein
MRLVIYQEIRRLFMPVIYYVFICFWGDSEKKTSEKISTMSYWSRSVSRPSLFKTKHNKVPSVSA